MMMDCDTLLMIGSSFPYSEFLPEEGQAKGVQIDIDNRMVSLRYPDGCQPGRRQQGNTKGFVATDQIQIKTAAGATK